MAKTKKKEQTEQKQNINGNKKLIAQAKIRNDAIIGLFRLAIKDRMGGIINDKTLSLMEQLEVEPILGYRLVDSFIKQINSDIDSNKLPTIKIRNLFYQQLIGMFGTVTDESLSDDNEWK